MIDVNKKQIGGTHYNQVSIQHWDLVLVNRLPYLEAQITKYVTRWKKKHGAEDIKKSMHYLEKLQSSLKEDTVPDFMRALGFDVLQLPQNGQNSAFGPRASEPVLLSEFCEENSIGDIERTIFYILLTYTTMDELDRVGHLLNHLLNLAQFPTFRNSL